MYRISPFIQTFALALLAGACVATIWVNLAAASYYDFIEWRLGELTLPEWMWGHTISLTPFLIITDILMSLFFFFIAKELWEAMILPQGALAGRKAILPIGLIFGGLLGAGLAWLGASCFLLPSDDINWYTGWQVALGTDTLLVYLFARRIFGPGHPALHLALLLAIGLDISALIILGASKTQVYSWPLLWLILPIVAAISSHVFCSRRIARAVTERERRAAGVLWPYILAGGVSWFGVAASGLPAALGLLPILPAIAHADRSFGIFAEAEALLHDPLNRLAHLLVKPLLIVLFTYGLIQGGIDLAAFTPTTLQTLGAFWIGRPLGMGLALLVIVPIFALSLPRGVTYRDLFCILIVLSLGFTVPLQAIYTSLPGGAMQEATRLGLALSLIAGPVAILWSKIR